MQINTLICYLTSFIFFYFNISLFIKLIGYFCMMKRIAIFASGNGTNAENICNYFKNSTRVQVVILCTNKQDALVINRVLPYGIPSFVFSKKDLNTVGFLEKVLFRFGVDLIVLAGFLLKIPPNLLDEFEKKVINVHPSLLPKYGGRGMYGDYVHKSVLDNNERETGVTFHYVNNKYDEGDIIHQSSCVVEEGETVGSLSKKVSELEHEFYPKIIEKIAFS